MTRSLFPERSGAWFSEDGRYRWLLWRRVGPGRRAINWLMLNPSTADDTRNDATVERCCRRARRAGYGRVLVTNLFGLRSPNPDALTEAEDPIGRLNDAAIGMAARRADGVACGWGAHGGLGGRASGVLRLLRGVSLRALGTTTEGHPRHPLYVSYDRELSSYSPREVLA